MNKGKLKEEIMRLTEVNKNLQYCLTLREAEVDALESRIIESQQECIVLRRRIEDRRKEG